MQELLPWLTLKGVPGIGNLLYNRLIRRFGSPQRVLEAPVDQLVQLKGIDAELACAIRRQGPVDEARRELEAVQGKGYSIVTLDDPQYPALLKQIPDPPPLLYVYGRLTAEAAAVAVVGSRKATSYGLSTTQRLCEELAAHGVTVVSGMALGIDTAAHSGALAVGGQTIAVLGTGLNRIYPPQNAALFHQIAEHGAVISEFAMDAPPEPRHFPMRNRIISGICLGTVVVEAAQRSGSLITARLASEQGREVFAVPGNIQATNSYGTHALIKQGAKLVQSVDDILEEIAPRLSSEGSPATPRPKPAEKPDGPEPSPLPPLSDAERPIFNALGAHPLHIDDLARRVKQDIAQVGALLMQLEIKGVALRQPGNYFSRSFDFARD
jgi:DNA processing protein